MSSLRINTTPRCKNICHQRQLHTHSSKLGLLAFVLMLTAGCASTVSEVKWPADMPERAIFVTAYEQQKAAGIKLHSLTKHLKWIKRFYRGSIIYPIGWNQMTDSVLDTLDPKLDKDAFAERMDRLGKLICIEWAQHDKRRKINSSAIAAWGNSLRTAVDKGEQEEFITKVENDVAALLRGEITHDRIVRERYYPPEDYDNF